jgi:Phosphoenolpyruvate phosphomutase
MTNVLLAIDTGIDALSINDRADGELANLPEAVARFRLCRRAIASSGVLLVARAQGLLSGRANIDDIIARLVAYSQAGADVVCAPGISEPATIEGSRPSGRAEAGRCPIAQARPHSCASGRAWRSTRQRGRFLRCGILGEFRARGAEVHGVRRPVTGSVFGCERDRRIAPRTPNQFRNPDFESKNWSVLARFRVRVNRRATSLDLSKASLAVRSLGRTSQKKEIYYERRIRSRF